MSDTVFICRTCGKQAKAGKGKPAPSCCEKGMEPLPYCTTVPNPEMSRFENPDEPCADGTTPKKYKK